MKARRAFGRIDLGLALLLGFALLGLTAAAVVWLGAEAVHRSEAKLLVRGPIPAEESPLDLEAEKRIIRSHDVASRTVAAIGVARLLPDQAEASEAEAAAEIGQHLDVDFVEGTGLLRLAFSHPEKGVAEPVLEELLRQYLVRHLEIHRSDSALPVVANIAILQSPSPEVIVRDPHDTALAGTLAIGAVLGGLCLAIGCWGVRALRRLVEGRNADDLRAAGGVS